MSLAEALLDLQKRPAPSPKVPLRPRAEGGVLKAVANVNDAIACAFARVAADDQRSLDEWTTGVSHRL